MKRLIDYHLREWKDSELRKPLLLRGARQVGKTFAARKLGASFIHFVEINFEKNQLAKTFFEDNLEPREIINALSLQTKQEIIPGKTLLFLDEIQECPRAIVALRYFYEELPELHVIAAGSLLEFAIEKVGIPVGRVTSLYVYPLTFFEFLVATENRLIAKDLLFRNPDKAINETIHSMAIKLLTEFLALGGMPEVIASWSEKRSAKECFLIHNTILDNYRTDFQKYAKKTQIFYVDLLFDQVPRQLGKPFKYSDIPGDYRKRELAPALNLLNLSGVVHEVHRSAGNGIPIGAEANPDHFKTIFLDVGLAQVLLGFDLTTWFLQPEKEWVNKGPLVEAFVGQEFLGYSSPIRKNKLYYWKKEKQSSQAEVDYLLPQENKVIPIEVKSGSGRTLKSMNIFLESHPDSPYGVRLSTHNYSIHEKIHSYPLYAISSLFKNEQNEAFTHLIS